MRAFDPMTQGSRRRVERAVLLPASEVEEKKRLIARKYRFDLLFVRPIRALQALLHSEQAHEETVIVAISLVLL